MLWWPIKPDTYTVVPSWHNGIGADVAKPGYGLSGAIFFD